MVVGKKCKSYTTSETSLGEGEDRTMSQRDAIIVYYHD